MSELKRCKQCGILKAADAFRPYSYARGRDDLSTSRFRICKQCESINTTYRKLCKERDEKFWDGVAYQYHYSAHHGPTDYAHYKKLVDDIAKIEALYYALEKHGYSVPAIIKPKSVIEKKEDMAPAAVGYAEKLLTFYAASEPTEVAKPVQQQTIALEAEELNMPNDLSFWLNMSMEDFNNKGFTPDYLQETIYESLKAKYRPQTGTNPTTFLPIYNDTYKSVLNQILRKFDDYEDWYAGQEDDNGSIEE